MLKFHIIIIKFSVFTNKNSESDTFFPKLKNTILKIDIKSFSVYLQQNQSKPTDLIFIIESLKLVHKTAK